MPSRKRHQRGMALVLTVFVAIVILGAATVVVYRAQSAKRMADAAVRRVMLDEVCKAGIDLGIEQIWNQYVVGNGNTTGNMASYRVFINNLAPNNEDLNGNGTQDTGETDLNGDGTFEISAPVDLVPTNQPRAVGPAGAVTRVTLARTDNLTGTTLTIRAMGQVGPETMTSEQTIRIAGQLFQGFQFAVLANNINCILCHAEFQALDLSQNTDPTLYGNFDRIKIASLESMLYRTNEACSNLAGTVYTRGQVYETDGSPLSAGEIASSTFKGYGFDNTNGKILQNPSTGAMSQTSLAAAGVDGDGMLNQFANLYMDYPAEEDHMTDGPLPNSFPAPYPDDNGNRLVDDSEFAPVMNSANGAITGGIAYGVPSGSSYTGTALPAASNGAAGALASTGVYDGNLILVGTSANPIVIDQKVVINGDLVIAGPVKGWGQLLARGNAYIVGDVTYADAPGEFGVASDGTPNGLALTAGGSILMGDYVTIRGKNHTQDTSKYPDKAQSIRSREANKSTTKRISGVTQTLRYGYSDPGVVDAGEIQTTMVKPDGSTLTRDGQQFSFTTSELMLFNNMEIEKALADPTYQPRFYGLRESQPMNLYVYDSPDEHSVRYDESGDTVQLVSDYLVDNGLPLDLLNNATIHYMNPQGNWLSEDTLRNFWWNDEQTRPSSGREFRFDGLLYSNNAVFALTRSKVRHGSYAYGAMRIRGGLVAADLGMLIPGEENLGSVGLTMLYDRRVARFLQIEDPTQVMFARTVFRRRV